LETHTGMMKVLYLTSWYPTDKDWLNGKFVKAHAESVKKQGADVRVLFVEQGPDWCKRFVEAWKELKKQWGLPNIVQLNVITKEGLLALWLNKRYGIPYIIVEHWTGYFPQCGTYAGFLHKQMAQLLCRNAARILTVSQQLAEAMQNHQLRGQYQEINNIVSAPYYDKPLVQRTSENKKRILNISCMYEEHKNVCGLLRAVKQIWDKRQDFELVVVGDGEDFERVRLYAQELGLLDSAVYFVGERSEDEVLEWFDRSDFFCFLSNYETAGIVLSESLVRGRPIISTPVGIAPEIINKDTGLLVQIGNEQQQVEAVEYMLDNCHKYNPENIRSYGEVFTESMVGSHLMEVYENTAFGHNAL